MKENYLRNENRLWQKIKKIKQNLSSLRKNRDRDHLVSYGGVQV